MPDLTYCYPNSNVLRNKLNIKNLSELFQAESELTALRLYSLYKNPIKGNFDCKHLQQIHKFLFQDLYAWAGQIRTVEIGKGNIFCTVACLQQYANSVFKNYWPECLAAKDNIQKFVQVLAKNYGDLNALHPFREGNGRTQREFTRLVCLDCGFDLTWQNITPHDMILASKMSFDTGNNTLFAEMFQKNISPHGSTKQDPCLEITATLAIEELNLSQEFLLQLQKIAQDELTSQQLRQSLLTKYRQ